MGLKSRGPDVHAAGSPHLTGEECVMSHRWIGGTRGMYLILSVLSRVGSSEKLLSLTQTVICGEKAGTTGQKEALRVKIPETLICTYSTLSDGLILFYE